MLSSHRLALRIALIYLGLAVGWILLSDRVVELISTDLATLGWVQTVKGLLFVALSAAVIYGLTYRELAARHRAESNLALLLETINEAVWTWTAADDRLTWNQRWWDMTGYSPGEVATTRKDWLALVHPDDRDQVLDDIAAAFEQDSPRYESEHRIRCKDGTWRWMRSRGRVVERMTGGAVVRVEGAYTDITVLREQKARLEQTVQALSESRRELDRFAFAAAHDLREPVRQIGSYAQLVERACSRETRTDIKEYLGYLVEGARTISFMLDGIQHRFEVEQSTRFVAVPLGRVLDTALDKHRDALDTSQARVSIDPLPVVQGDFVQLTALFDALISNALKFARPGQAPIIAVTRKDGPLGHRIEVSDEGIGFTADQGAILFDPFRRLNTAGTYPGAGMGLAICRAIVLHHGGEISARPGREGGAVLTIDLPAGTDADALPHCA